MEWYSDQSYSSLQHCYIADVDIAFSNFYSRDGSLYVAKAGLEILGSSCPSAQPSK